MQKTEYFTQDNLLNLNKNIESQWHLSHDLPPSPPPPPHTASCDGSSFLGGAAKKMRAPPLHRSQSKATILPEEGQVSSYSHTTTHPGSSHSQPPTLKTGQDSWGPIIPSPDCQQNGSSMIGGIIWATIPFPPSSTLSEYTCLFRRSRVLSPSPAPEHQCRGSVSTRRRKTHSLEWLQYLKCLIFRNFPGGPVVKKPLPMQGTWVRSLVEELRPHMPQGN